MRTAGFSETLALIYQATWHHSPEDHHVIPHRLRLFQAKVFIMQVACKRTQFSACGFFCLSLALIRPVSGSIT
jgi:hypothetical protein